MSSPASAHEHGDFHPRLATREVMEVATSQPLPPDTETARESVVLQGAGARCTQPRDVISQPQPSTERRAEIPERRRAAHGHQT